MDVSSSKRHRFPKRVHKISVQKEAEILLRLHKAKPRLLQEEILPKRPIIRSPEKQTLQTQVDTLRSVDQETKAWRTFLQKKIQQKKNQLLQEAFLLEFEECPTDEEDLSDLETSDEDTIELEDTMEDLTDDDMEMER